MLVRWDHELETSRQPKQCDSRSTMLSDVLVTASSRTLKCCNTRSALYDVTSATDPLVVSRCPAQLVSRNESPDRWMYEERTAYTISCPPPAKDAVVTRLSDNASNLIPDALFRLIHISTLPCLDSPVKLADFLLVGTISQTNLNLVGRLHRSDARRCTSHDQVALLPPAPAMSETEP